MPFLVCRFIYGIVEKRESGNCHIRKRKNSCFCGMLPDYLTEDKDTMIRYDFMQHKKKSDIQKDIEVRYGVSISGKSWLDVQFVNENLEKILMRECKNIQSDLNDIFEKLEKADNEVDEIRKLQEGFTKIYGIIGNVEKYSSDLLADSFMGLLQIEKDCNIPFKDSYKQCWDADACNKSINMENAKKNYPFADISNFFEDGIPGGCEAYHDLMMQQKNIGIFDINTNIKSLQRYAFPRTSNIYHALEDSPIENLLLLEKTQGIGYTNQFFRYIQEVKQKEQLDKLSGIIKYNIKIPMFIRKDIAAVEWSYLSDCKYSDMSLQYAENIFDNISYAVKCIYKKLLKFYWYVFYLAYLEKYISGVDLYLKQCWQQYFDEDEAYNEYIKEENLCDWRNIEFVEDCFYPLHNVSLECTGEKECDGYKMLVISDLKGQIEIISFIMADGSSYIIVAAAPLNDLGKMVREEANTIFQNKLNYLKIEKSSKEYEELEKEYYAIRKECFENKKAKEKKAWIEKDIKIPTNKLKPVHVYAIIHEKVVRLLLSKK
ncbi:MAG: hypothetical protein NC321_02625 [Clostridium sp.]|nr:hypothetical protein [Clostridium sp.]